MQNHPFTPFQQGQYLARFLFRQGVFDRGMLLYDREACHTDAVRYARYAAPGAPAETIRTIAAGLMYGLAVECDRERRETL